MTSLKYWCVLDPQKNSALFFGRSDSVTVVEATVLNLVEEGEEIHGITLKRKESETVEVADLLPQKHLALLDLCSPNPILSRAFP